MQFNHTIFNAISFWNSRNFAKDIYWEKLNISRWWICDVLICKVFYKKYLFCIKYIIPTMPMRQHSLNTSWFILRQAAEQISWCITSILSSWATYLHNTRRNFYHITTIVMTNKPCTQCCNINWVNFQHCTFWI